MIPLPPPNGKGLRIKDVSDPSNPLHAQYIASGSLDVTGAVVIGVDEFDETLLGNSHGTIYVQDLGSTDAYSGSSLFSPTFTPGNLHVGAGDVLELSGAYVEEPSLGTTVTFAPGSFLPQFNRPSGAFQFELASIQDPKVIDVADLSDFVTGQKWLNMLVTVENVTVLKDVNKATQSGGRLSVDLLPGGTGSGCNSPFPKAPQLTNELFDATQLNIPQNTTLKSLTGIVTFFCNFHIAPRSPADVVVQ